VRYAAHEAARYGDYAPVDLNARQTLPFRAGKDSGDAEGIHYAPRRAYVAAQFGGQYYSAKHLVSKAKSARIVENSAFTASNVVVAVHVAK
jgi:hypothetical protein